ncbi:tigger transposable element-derived protein 1, partial [Caerostris darwini]
TYITAEEEDDARSPLEAYEGQIDSSTVRQCSGDCKIKPLLVYHSENPRAFKSHKIFERKTASYVEVEPEGMGHQEVLCGVGPGWELHEDLDLSAWKKLWPEAVAERIYEELEPGVSVEEEIVSLGEIHGSRGGRERRERAHRGVHPGTDD